MQHERQIPCSRSKQVEPGEVPPVRPDYLPKPHTWEVWAEQNDPNNPYNVVDQARQVRALSAPGAAGAPGAAPGGGGAGAAAENAAALRDWIARIDELRLENRGLLEELLRHAPAQHLRAVR